MSAPAPTNTETFPARCARIAENRERHGDLVDLLAPYYFKGDPLADAVVDTFAAMPPGKGSKLLNRALAEGVNDIPNLPESLRALMQQVTHKPLWVDLDKVNLGGATYMRAGFLGSLALLCYSLPYGYLSPAANKPLVFSGRLVQRAYRRLMETSRFVLEVCKPGGLEVGAPGFMISVRVRLMHAQVRRLLLKSGRWETRAWGVPINQSDLLGTNTLFSIIVLQALRKCGLTFSEEESEAVMHFWKYNGYLSGIEPEILASTESEGWRILNLIMDSREAADDDSRTLARSLMDAGGEAAHSVMGFEETRWVSRALYGFSQAFIGAENARELNYPKTIWSRLLPFLKILVACTEVFRKIAPGGNKFARRVGERMWQFAITNGLQGRPAQFGLPEKLDSQLADKNKKRGTLGFLKRKES
ncbi:MAG: oxygenase MpaB family protein [Leptospirales bacterium]